MSRGLRTVWHNRQLLVAIFLLQASTALAASSISATTGTGNLGTTVTQAGTTFDITGGTRNGTNLFHSFGLFSVGAGDTANFLNNTNQPTTNILGRVTGGQVSNISGTIKTTGFGKASLYLMNPAGWVFGPTASLNVGGSFHVSTADYLKFADGAKFHADLSKQSTLTSAPVSAFGFLSQNPGGISTQSSVLRVPIGQALSVIGGNVQISGESLTAPSGLISIASVTGSVASPLEVPQILQGFDPSQIEKLGDITVSSGARIDVNGTSTAAPGTVVIRGGSLKLLNSSVLVTDNFSNMTAATAGMDVRLTGDVKLQSGSIMASGSFGLGKAGNVVVNATNLDLESGASVSTSTFGPGDAGTAALTLADNFSLNNSYVFAVQARTAQNGGTGQAGNVVINAKTINLHNDAAIFTETSGAGNGGTAQLTASDTVTLNKAAISAIQRNTEQNGGTGKSGNIVINAKNLVLDQQGFNGINTGTYGSGGAGSITITVDSLSANNYGIFSVNSGRGQGGNIVVTARNVGLENNAAMDAATDGPGNGGNIQITASDTITVNKAAITAIQRNTEQNGGTGKSGDIVINAKNLVLDQQGFNGVNTGTLGSGGAGSITISVDSLSANNYGIFSANSGRGQGGDIVVTAQNISLTNGAQINTQTDGPGNGGTVVVEAKDVTVTNGATIISSTLGLGSAGTVTVRGDNVTLGAGFIVSSTSGSGNAGTVNVYAGNLNVGTGGTIRSAAFQCQTQHCGNAGSVTVNADSLTITNRSFIDSTSFSQNGNAGTVTVKAGSLLIDGQQGGGFTGIASDASAGTGTGGSVDVNVTGQATIRNGGTIVTRTFGNGNAGTVNVNAESLVIDGGSMSSSTNSGRGKGGDIVVMARNVSLENGAFMAAQTGGPGNGGNVQITASDTISVNKAAITAIQRNTEQNGGMGKSGNIVIYAKNLVLDQQGFNGVNTGTYGSGGAGSITISVDSLSADNYGIFSANSGRGLGGDIVITARNIGLNNGAQINAQTDGLGSGGKIHITANDTISLDNGKVFAGSLNIGAGGSIDIQAKQMRLNQGAAISATSSGAGSAGNIDIIASDGFRSVNSSVTTQAEFADGGNIHLKVGKLVELVNSQITTSVQGGAGAGGNILIDPQFVILNNSQITANAFGGPGGNITIIADNFLASPDSAVTASSALSTPGTIDIQAPITDLSGSLAPLPESIVQATSLLRQSCATRYGSGKLSSLASPGRGGMPFEPGGLLASGLFSLADSSTTRDHSEPVQATVASALPRFSIASPCATF